jgi:hypothetical protein
MKDEGATSIGRRDDRGRVSRQIDHGRGGLTPEGHRTERVSPPAGHEERVAARDERRGHGLVRERDQALARERLIDLRHRQDVRLPVVGPEGHHASGRRHQHRRRARAERSRCQRPEGLEVEGDDRAVVGIGHESEATVAEPGDGHRAGGDGARCVGRLEGQPVRGIRSPRDTRRAHLRRPWGPRRGAFSQHDVLDAAGGDRQERSPEKRSRHAPSSRGRPGV